jgi:hypothetical protein
MLSTSQEEQKPIESYGGDENPTLSVGHKKSILLRHERWSPEPNSKKLGSNETTQGCGEESVLGGMKFLQKTRKRVRKRELRHLQVPGYTSMHGTEQTGGRTQPSNQPELPLKKFVLRPSPSELKLGRCAPISAHSQQKKVKGERQK